MACNHVYECIDDWLMNKYTAMNESLNIMQLNIRGMNDLAKFDCFKEVLHRYGKNVDVVVLCETWIKDDRTCLFELDGFKGIFSCRTDSHGGLVVYIRDNIVADVYLNAVLDGFHHIHCRLSTHGNPIDFHAMYRPPSFDIRKFLYEVENILSSVPRGYECILVGDMNIPVNLASNNVVCEYVRLLASYNVFVTNTCVTRPASGNVLDHVACSAILANNVVNETVFVDFSDHSIIMSSFGTRCRSSVTILQKRIVDHRRLSELFRESMNGLPQSCAANDKLLYLIDCYNVNLAQSSKIVSMRAKLKGHCPWMSMDVWWLMKEKEKLFKKKRRNPQNEQTAELFAHVSKLLSKKKSFM